MEISSIYHRIVFISPVFSCSVYTYPTNDKMLSNLFLCVRSAWKLIILLGFCYFLLFVATCHRFPAACTLVTVDQPAAHRISSTVSLCNDDTMGKRAAGFVVFRRIQGMIEYLLMQTSYGEHHWTPPKGHVDPGESDLDAAVRETKEESGLLLSDLKVFDHVKRELIYEVKEKPKTVVYWLAELLNSDKSIELSEEHQAYQWLSIEDACSVVKYSDMQSMLRNLNEYIHQNLS